MRHEPKAFSSAPSLSIRMPSMLCSRRTRGATRVHRLALTKAFPERSETATFQWALFKTTRMLLLDLDRRQGEPKPYKKTLKTHFPACFYHTKRLTEYSFSLSISLRCPNIIFGVLCLLLLAPTSLDRSIYLPLVGVQKLRNRNLPSTKHKEPTDDCKASPATWLFQTMALHLWQRPSYLCEVFPSLL